MAEEGHTGSPRRRERHVFRKLFQERLWLATDEGCAWRRSLELREQTRPIPKLDSVAVHQLPGTILGFVITLAKKVNPEENVAVCADLKRSVSVLAHSAAPGIAPVRINPDGSFVFRSEHGEAWPKWDRIGT